MPVAPAPLSVGSQQVARHCQMSYGGQKCPFVVDNCSKVSLFFFPDNLSLFLFPLNPLELLSISHPISVLLYQCEPLCIWREFWPQLSQQLFVPGPFPRRTFLSLLPDKSRCCSRSPSHSECLSDSSFPYQIHIISLLWCSVPFKILTQLTFSHSSPAASLYCSQTRSLAS